MSTTSHWRAKPHKREQAFQRPLPLLAAGAHSRTVNAIAPGFFATEANAAAVAQPEYTVWLAQRTSF